jgi:hypothetical protein
MSVCYRVVAATVMCSTVLRSQVPSVNVLAPTVLSLPASARVLGMGNVGVVSRDDDVLFYNPAQLAIARGMSASGGRYSSSARGSTLSSVTRFNNGGIAVGINVVDFRSPGPGLPGGPDLDRAGTGPASSLDAVLGLAQVYKSVRVGVAAKYVEDQLPDVRIGRGAFDIGLAKDFMRYYSVGLAVQNIGGSSTYPCPTCTLALSGVPPNPALTVRAESPIRTTLSRRSDCRCFAATGFLRRAEPSWATAGSMATASQCDSVRQRPGRVRVARRADSDSRWIG